MPRVSGRTVINPNNPNTVIAVADFGPPESVWQPIKPESSATVRLVQMPMEPELAKQLLRTVGNIDKHQIERERLIVLAYVRGASLRDIASVAGMTHVGVKKLIEREMADWVVYDENNNITVREVKQPRD